MRELLGRGARPGLATLLAVGLLSAGAAGAATPAPDGPGALSHFDLARKDCLGTARNRTSKTWYTVADGVLSDVYYPTADNTNVETLQYVVTDGSTFTDLQTRDMTYTVSALDRSGLTCRVTTTAKSGKYRLVTDFVTDPRRNAVLMRTTFKSLVGPAGRYRLYVRFDPTVNGNGGGGSGNGGADSGTLRSELHQAHSRRAGRHARGPQRPPGRQRRDRPGRAVHAALRQRRSVQFAETDHHPARPLLHDGRQPWLERRQPLLGTNPRDWIIGKAFATYWPPDRVGIL